MILLAKLAPAHLHFRHAASASSAAACCKNRSLCLPSDSHIATCLIRTASFRKRKTQSFRSPVGADMLLPVVGWYDPVVMGVPERLKLQARTPLRPPERDLAHLANSPDWLQHPKCASGRSDREPRRDGGDCRAGWRRRLRRGLTRQDRAGGGPPVPVSFADFNRGRPWASNTSPSNLRDQLSPISFVLVNSTPARRASITKARVIWTTSVIQYN